MGTVRNKRQKKINMKVTIVLDGSDLSASTLKHFFTKIYDSALHEISFLYALPNFSVSTGKVTTYPLQNFADIRKTHPRTVQTQPTDHRVQFLHFWPIQKRQTLDRQCRGEIRPGGRQESSG